MPDPQLTDLIQEFEEQGAHLQAVAEYLTATGQDAKPAQALYAAWQRGQTALIILAARPEEAADTDFVLAALTDIMDVIEATLLPGPQQQVWLPERVA